jgi:tetratricopeptide (TPR) repeat protein
MGIRLGTLAKPDIPFAHSNLAMALNDLAWRLVTIADPKPLAQARAVEFAKEAVELIPQASAYWNTLGAAQYRAGDWKAAIAALEKSMELRQDGDSFDWFFLAMTHWQLGNKEEARKWCDQAVAWMDKNQPQNEDLLRFRAEAQELLKISNQRPTTKPEVK